MKKAIFILSALLSILISCDDKDYPPYNVDIEIEGDGIVSGAGTYSFGNQCKLIAEHKKDSEFRFTGWYLGEELLSRDKEYLYSGKSDSKIKAVFSDNVYNIQLYYIQKFQKEYFVVRGDAVYLYINELKDWNPLYGFLGWEAHDSETGEFVISHKNIDWHFVPDQNLKIYTDWDMR